MTVSQLIKNRRTIRDFKKDKISLPVLEELLDISVWAPYYSDIEPWRFIVISEEGKTKLLDIILKSLNTAERERYKSVWEKEILSAPLILIVVSKTGQNSKIADEALYASAALIQNFQLAAWELGIGTVWKTNAWIYSPDANISLNVYENEKIVGVMYCGYPERVPPAKARRSGGELMTIF